MHNEVEVRDLPEKLGRFLGRLRDPLARPLGDLQRFVRSTGLRRASTSSLIALHERGVESRDRRIVARPTIEHVDPTTPGGEFLLGLPGLPGEGRHIVELDRQELLAERVGRAEPIGGLALLDRPSQKVQLLGVALDLQSDRDVVQAGGQTQPGIRVVGPELDQPFANQQRLAEELQFLRPRPPSMARSRDML